MLLDLKTKSRTGSDNIPSKGFDTGEPSVAHFLLIIFEASFLCGILPRHWHITGVVLVKDDRLSLDNRLYD